MQLYYGNAPVLPHLMATASFCAKSPCSTKLHPLKFSKDAIPVLLKSEGGIHSSWNQTQTDCYSKDEAVTSEMQYVGTEISVGYREQKRTWVGEVISGQ